jgi:hypothetical protein
VVDAEVQGGRGDDFLMFDVYGVEDPANLHAQIDGGEGFDIAKRTSGGGGGRSGQRPQVGSTSVQEREKATKKNGR